MQLRIPQLQVTVMNFMAPFCSLSITAIVQVKVVWIIFYFIDPKIKDVLLAVHWFNVIRKSIKMVLLNKYSI